MEKLKRMVAPTLDVGQNRKSTIDPQAFLSFFEMSIPHSIILTLDDAALIAAASSAFGFTHTTCKHCGHRPAPLERFAGVMRKRAAKKGVLTADNFPKSCDKQDASNTKANPINNKYYNKLRPEMPREEVRELLIARDAEVAARTDLKLKPLVFKEERKAALVVDPKDAEIARLKAALLAAHDELVASKDALAAAEVWSDKLETRAMELEATLVEYL